MSRRAAEPALALPPLIRDGEALPRQLAESLRQAILDGRLQPGSRVPATRSLAAQLQVGRNTVLTAYEHLQAEGFLTSRQGSGTVVAPLPAPARGHEPVPERPLSRQAELFLRLQRPQTRMWVDALVPGVPDLDHFPWAEWARLLARRWRRPGRELLTPTNLAGYPPLCAAIAEWLGRTRGVRCSPAQVMIVSGSQQALDLTARVLLDPGDTTLIEDPCYGGLRGVLEAAGIHIAALPVDAQGFDIATAQDQWPKARVAWVTPSHQYPTGATMPLSRRLALVDWARQRQGWIVEDDYDADFCHSGPPLTAVQGLDGDRRTVHVGTFSKSMFPGLRLGWMVLPPDLVAPFLAARRLADMAPPSMTQAAMADFMAEGLFARHLKRMRAVYSARRAAFTTAFERHLAAFGTMTPGESGLHSVLWLNEGWNDREAAARAANAGIPIPCLSDHSVSVTRPGLILGWGHIAEDRMEKAAIRLTTALAVPPQPTA